MKLKSPIALVIRGLLVLSGIVALLVCLGSQVLSVKAQSPSFVRIIHASPDVGTADVFVDGSKLLSSFAFGTVTDYAAIPAGPHTVQIALVGKGVGGAALTQTLNVSPGVAYTVAAIGTSATGVSLQVFIDNNLLTPGTAKVRVYHLASDLGTVNVSNGGSTDIYGLAYPQVSNYLSVPAGAYTFNVTSTQTGVTSPVAVTLKNNMVTSIFAVGLLNGTPKFAFTTAQASGLPGLPGTGSDPNAPPPSESTPFSTTWLLGSVGLFMLGIGLFARRRVAR